MSLDIKNLAGDLTFEFCEWCVIVSLPSVSVSLLPVNGEEDPDHQKWGTCYVRTTKSTDHT